MSGGDRFELSRWRQFYCSPKLVRSWRHIRHLHFVHHLSLTAYLCVIIAKAAKDSESSSPLPSHSLNKLTAGGLFLALVTTLLLTSLISYRIHFTCKQDLRSGSRNLFKHIVEIIVQSAAAHALITLMTAICVAIPVNEGNVASVTSAQLYMAALYPFTAVRVSLSVPCPFEV